MEFSIGRLSVSIVVRSDNPFDMGKRAKRCLANRILAKTTGGKIERIKVLRLIALEKGWPGGLRAAKDWVEEVFADDGRGDIAI